MCALFSDGCVLLSTTKHWCAGPYLFYRVRIRNQYIFYSALLFGLGKGYLKVDRKNRVYAKNGLCLVQTRSGAKTKLGLAQTGICFISILQY